MILIELDEDARQRALADAARIEAERKTTEVEAARKLAGATARIKQAEAYAQAKAWASAGQEYTAAAEVGGDPAHLLAAADGAAGDLHPVVDPWGRAAGVVSLAAAKRVPVEARASNTVAEVMRRVTPGDLVAPDQDLEGLLAGEMSSSRVFLVVEGDAVLGILVAGEALEAV